MAKSHQKYKKHREPLIHLKEDRHPEAKSLSNYYIDYRNCHRNLEFQSLPRYHNYNRYRAIPNLI